MSRDRERLLFSYLKSLQTKYPDLNHLLSEPGDPDLKKFLAGLPDSSEQTEKGGSDPGDDFYFAERIFGKSETSEKKKHGHSPTDVLFQKLNLDGPSASEEQTKVDPLPVKPRENLPSFRDSTESPESEHLPENIPPLPKQPATRSEKSVLSDSLSARQHSVQKFEQENPPVNENVNIGQGLPSDETIMDRNDLTKLNFACMNCRRCPLSTSRTNIVMGSGYQNAHILFVGEGPGEVEDQKGLPFVGKSGMLLSQFISYLGLNRESAFITNVVKCRPPENRDPHQEEIDACFPILRQQIKLIQPKIIVTVGRHSTKLLTGQSEGITKIHGKLFSYDGIPCMPVFHPAYVLRRREVMEDYYLDFYKIRNLLEKSLGDPSQAM